MRIFLIIFLINLFTINYSFSEKIKDLEINGNKRLSIETIKVIGDIDLKNEFDNDKLNELVKKLYESNFFKDVSLIIENETLKIDLIENPIIENIQIEGIEKDSIKNVLLESISLKDRKPYTENLLKQDIDLISNILKSNGYYFATVSPSVVKNELLNSISIRFNIDQGKRAKIKNISFIGDKKIKDKKLLEIIASEEHKFWKFISKKVYLDQLRIDLDKRLIENYYKNLGYYDISVVGSFAEFNNNGDFNLVFNIDAGEIFYFNDLKLNLPKDYNQNDFLEISNYLKKLKGKKFSIDDFNLILNEIEKIASSRLYDFIDAKVNEQIIDNKINFEFNVSDSTSSYVEQINILGNYNTLEEVIRNKLIVDEGDPLNNVLFNKSLDNIRSLRIFKSVDANIKEGSDKGLKRIDIKVEEMPTGEISLAAGVGSSGSSIGGGIVEKNFLGKGINLDTNIEISQNSLKGQFIYSKPNFAYTDNTLSTSLSSTTTDNLSDFGYKMSELSFSIGSIYEQFENLFFSPSIEFTAEDLKTSSKANSIIKKQEGEYLDLYFDYGLNYDLRNSKYKPTAGNNTRFVQELPISSDVQEITNTFIYDHYKKIFKTSEVVGKMSIYLKSVNSIQSNEDVRISKRTSVPYNRLRGFEKGKVGPIDNNDYIGGNYVSSLNLSSNLPFLLPSLETIDFSFFIDAANVWGVDYDSAIDDSNVIRTSTGLGMNILTPIGPLSFSLSEAITKKSTDKTESFRFNLGTTF